jgi:hypothetical protein
MAERKPRPSEATYRCCPACGVVRPASSFKRAAGKPDYGPERPTRCPDCGHVGQHRTFMRAGPAAWTERGDD